MFRFTRNADTVYPGQPVFSVDAAANPTAAIQELRTSLILLHSMRNTFANHPVQKPTPKTIPAPSPVYSLKGAELGQFSGKAQDVKRFLQNLQDDMELLGPVFPTERVKVIYMASYLREARNVSDWVASVRVSHPEWFDDFVAFTRAFEARFSRDRAMRRLARSRVRVQYSDVVLYSTL